MSGFSSTWPSINTDQKRFLIADREICYYITEVQTNHRANHYFINMTNSFNAIDITPDLASKLMAEQFPEYAHLPITSVEKQGHDNRQTLAREFAQFLKELQRIDKVEGPAPGQHNWWRGDHVSVYDQGAREQIAYLTNVINAPRALRLWEEACTTRWRKHPVWIHGDFAIGNILLKDGKLSAVIDFGGMALGDPACDLVIAWTFLNGKPREIFIKEMGLDEEKWLRAKAWALWKASYELCQIVDLKSSEASIQKKIIEEITAKF